jgi:Tol biopolymer transport system component
VDELGAVLDDDVRQPAAVSADAVRAQLTRVLRSSPFSNAPSLSRLLSHIVEQTLDGHADRLKEYSLGVDVFDRGDAFDPRIDTIVRVQARRLRSKLQEYYRRDGPEDPVVIELTKGRYVPEFRGRAIAPTRTVVEWPRRAVQRPGDSTVVPAAGFRARPHKALIGLATLIVLSAAGITVRQFRASDQPLPSPSEYVQITDFTDSATAPSLSPDGRMVAFIRGGDWFLSRGQIYVKQLPNGEPVQLTTGTDAKLGPVFTPDGSHVTYTRAGQAGWETWMVPVTGGEPTRLLPNASGLVWLDANRVMFSEIRAPEPHMGVVIATQTRAASRDIYFPVHERGMAHYSHPSPDRRNAVVIEMDATGTFQPCRLVPMEGGVSTRRVGPAGRCTSAGWSSDGKWMYFSVEADGRSHLWRQAFPDGEPEQITFGPTGEEGVAVAPDGRSLVTSIGRRRSAIWIHDREGERPLTTEGFAFAPKLGPGGTRVYYLFRQQPDSTSTELRAIDLESGSVARILPGLAIADNDISGINYDISRDEQEVVFATREADGAPAVWLARLDRTVPPRRIAGNAELVSFGAHDDLFFVSLKQHTSVLARIAKNGGQPQRIGDLSPIINRSGVSPDGAWVVVYAASGDGRPETMAIPVSGGTPRRICPGLCWAWWSADATSLYVDIFGPPQRTVVIPLAPNRVLPDLPESGLIVAEGDVGMPDATVIHGSVLPLGSPSTYVFARTELRRNLYRIPLW